MNRNSERANPSVYEEVLSSAIDVVINAGEAIMEYFESSFDVREKSVDNPVTDADLAADKLLREQLSNLLPSAGWLSEETVDNPSRLKKPLTWIVDPLDGTKEFVQGIPEFAISVALVSENRPILGIVYNPATMELFSCLEGTGVYLNNRHKEMSTNGVLANMTVGASRSERNRGEFDPFEQIVDVRTIGSIAYKLARVAAGQEDATWSRGPKNEWDICAGTLMVTESGGFCVDLDSNRYIFNRANPKVNGVIATNRLLFDQVIEMLHPHRSSART